jgi:hypothetical protein
MKKNIQRTNGVTTVVGANGKIVDNLKGLAGPSGKVILIAPVVAPETDGEDESEDGEPGRTGTITAPPAIEKELYPGFQEEARNTEYHQLAREAGLPSSARTGAMIAFLATPGKWEGLLERRKFVAPDARYGVEGDCWIFTGSLSSGYGQAAIKLPGQKLVGVMLHRLALAYDGRLAELVLEGKEADHLCHRTACFNPAHLVAATGSDNNARGKNKNLESFFSTYGTASKRVNAIMWACQPENRDKWIKWIEDRTEWRDGHRVLTTTPNKHGYHAVNIYHQGDSIPVAVHNLSYALQYGFYDAATNPDGYNVALERDHSCVRGDGSKSCIAHLIQMTKSENAGSGRAVVRTDAEFRAANAARYRKNLAGMTDAELTEFRATKAVTNAARYGKNRAAMTDAELTDYRAADALKSAARYERKKAEKLAATTTTTTEPIDAASDWF